MFTYNSAEDFGDEQSLYVLGREEDGREPGDAGQTGENGPAVAEAFGDDSVEEEAEDFANVGALGLC